MILKVFTVVTAVVLFTVNSAHADTSFNYAEALQKSLYFYEAQQSGPLSPNNRVAWRGPSCLTDGKDIGHDLAGGWYDAGDHWTANLTMSFAATTLAFSAIEHPEAYLRSNQMDELLESLIYVNRYFLKCILNPNVQDPAHDLEVAIGCGAREGVDGPNVHAMWAPAEVAHLMTSRPTFRLNKQVPGGDIPAAMAASMAASSIVIRQHSAVLANKKGYETFDASAFADQLLDSAEKLLLFAKANAGPALTDKLPKDQQEQIRRARNSALRSDGKVVEIGYRSGPFDKIFVAASFLQRAHLAKNPNFGDKWYTFANAVYDNEYKAENNNDWWKDFGAGNFGKLGAYNMMRLAPAEEKFHAELQLYCSYFTKYKDTPGGLRLREWFAHEYGSLRHANNAAMIALYYSQHVESAPALKGNTWWKDGKSNPQLKDLYFTAAKRQVDYALGANPYGRSYLVGFGNQSFNNVHHRGAYGAWAGFLHFIKGKPEFRPTQSRHILYGALVGGPDHNDVFLCASKRSAKEEPNDKGGKDWVEYYQFPNRPAPVSRNTYTFDPNDQPYQEVMDSKFNEVALDYNAGITASFALLTAKGLSTGNALPDTQFPPSDPRNSSTDLLTTDREFFVAARQAKTEPNAIEIEATLYNRSRWPSRVTDNLSFRYFFTLDGSAKPEDVHATLIPSDDATLGPVTHLKSNIYFVEVCFPNTPVFPGNRDKNHDLKRARLRLQSSTWNNANDFSHQGMTTDFRLLPSIPVYDAGQLLAGQQP
ncbi:MAG TPA: glycoside hydrolase family 9 protein [Tepidisphaeraceae bacterium]|nr:glycoside hydrolase family 9 protein [Tepidisphaeraceae bacterium]